MCRTGEVFRQCDCGADITCTFELFCRPCHSYWLEVDDSELGDDD